VGRQMPPRMSPCSASSSCRALDAGATGQLVAGTGRADQAAGVPGAGRRFTILDPDAGAPLAPHARTGAVDEIAATPRRLAPTRSSAQRPSAARRKLLASIRRRRRGPTCTARGGVVADPGNARWPSCSASRPPSSCPAARWPRPPRCGVHADARGLRTVLWHPHCHLSRGTRAGRTPGLPRPDRALGRRPRPGYSPGDGPERGRRAGRGAAHRASAARPWAASCRPSTDPGRAGGLGPGAGRGGPPGPAPGCGRRRPVYRRPPGRDPAALLRHRLRLLLQGRRPRLPGCCVAGSAGRNVAQVKEWRKRLGGTLFALWPAAASARHRLAADAGRDAGPDGATRHAGPAGPPLDALARRPGACPRHPRPR